MPVLNYFDDYKLALGSATHDYSSHTLKVALTNSAPTAATDTQLSDITEISAGNGYSAGGPALTTSSYTQSSGVATVAITDVVITASGGSIGPFRYAVIYNDTATGDPLIGYYDYGSSLTLADGETLTVDFPPQTLTIS